MVIQSESRGLRILPVCHLVLRRHAVDAVDLPKILRLQVSRVLSQFGQLLIFLQDPQETSNWYDPQYVSIVDSYFSWTVKLYVLELFVRTLFSDRKSKVLEILKPTNPLVGFSRDIYGGQPHINTLVRLSG